jgi:Protein of unknown function (DUF4127)
MNIGLIPLDERPVNVRYPRMIGDIAGERVQLPPPSALSHLRQPADCAALAVWAADVAPSLDALIVSLEMFGYGSLITSRISNEPAADIVARLEQLRTLKKANPRLMIYGFNLITRVSNANDALEEPQYWQDYGTRLYRLSQLIDKTQVDAQPDPAANDVTELAQLRAEIPPQYARDFLRRRVRNHTVNLHALQMLGEGVFDTLVLSSDDTSPFGLPTREKRWLTENAARLGLGDNLLMYPGADEVGCALVARAIHAYRGAAPAFGVRSAIPNGEHVVAAFEDGPISLTIERQVRAVGGRMAANGESDFDIVVNTPVERRSEWHPAYAESERSARQPHLAAAVHAVAGRESRTVMADVAYPNGADPVLMELMRAHLDLPHLAAYGAWNTAGNTIGTALAQACATRFMTTPLQREAQQHFLLHRFIEDWGYQHVARAELQALLIAQTGNRGPARAAVPECEAWIETRLNELIGELEPYAGRYAIAPGSVHLPWQRTFEVDFELERTT